MKRDSSTTKPQGRHHGISSVESRLYYVGIAFDILKIMEIFCVFVFHSFFTLCQNCLYAIMTATYFDLKTERLNTRDSQVLFNF